jgi:type II secretory pathway pseudopilin PulG
MMRRAEAGFSLVEIAFATGIFAFVAVAILSLFSVALDQRMASDLETKASIIAEEIVSSVSMSGGPKAATFRDGPALQTRNNQTVNLTTGKVLLGYPKGTTTPFGLWHPSRGQDPQVVWEAGITQSWALENQIQTLALVSADRLSPDSDLYRITCQVRSPASLPAHKSRVETFSTLTHAP